MSKWFLPLAFGSAVVFLVVMSAALEYQREPESEDIPVKHEDAASGGRF